jgi:aspartyl protease family protein
MQQGEIQQTHTLGKIMAFMAWIIFFALTTLLLDKWIKDKYEHLPIHQNIKEFKGTKYTILQRNLSNHYLAFGSINNEKVLFLLDTGATEVVIPGELAEELGLKKGQKINARTAAGPIEIYRTKIKSLTIGHIKLKNVSASINPSMDGEEILLGMNVLNLINFRQQDGRLILSERTK